MAEIKMCEKSNSLTDSALSKQQTSQQLRKTARHLTENLPLLDACEFCGDTQRLEHMHLDYKNYPTIYLTGCKKCHEYADKKNPDTQQLAYDKKEQRIWHYIHKLNPAYFRTEYVHDGGRRYFRIFDKQTKQKIKEVDLPK